MKKSDGLFLSSVKFFWVLLSKIVTQTSLFDELFHYSY